MDLVEVRVATIGASAPDPSHTDATVCVRPCTRTPGRPIALAAAVQATDRFQLGSERGPLRGA